MRQDVVDVLKTSKMDLVRALIGEHMFKVPFLTDLMSVVDYILKQVIVHL